MSEETKQEAVQSSRADNGLKYTEVVAQSPMDGSNLLAAESASKASFFDGPVKFLLRRFTNGKDSQKGVAQAGSGGLLVRTFALAVFLPTMVAALYYIFFATDQYASESRFTVRSAQTQEQTLTGALALAAKFTGSAATSQDGFAVINYIRSRSIIEDIGGREVVERIYNPAYADWFAAIGVEKPWEKVARYWRAMVRPAIDTQSNIITVEARAFTPQDARWLVEQIVLKSELLVNKISERNRRETLALASADLVTAGQQLTRTQDDLRRFRNTDATVDPVQDVKAIAEVIASLTMKKIELQARLGTIDNVLDSDAPSRRLLESSMREINEQIEQQRALVVGSGKGQTLSDSLSEFERLRIEEEFASKRYVIAQSSFEAAKKQAERQQLFLVEIVSPTDAESSTYPEAIANVFSVFFVTLVLWAIGALIVAGIRDHAV